MMDGVAHSGRPLELEIRCPVDPQVLPALRCMVVSLCRQAGFEEEAVDQVEMAVDEACTNVVRHAYRHQGISLENPPPDGERDQFCFWLRIELWDHQLKLSVIDNGIGIRQTPPGFSSIEEFTAHGGGTGGLGILIIHKFMDEVNYHCPDESGTVLTMVKYLRRGADKAH